MVTRAAYEDPMGLLSQEERDAARKALDAPPEKEPT